MGRNCIETWLEQVEALNLVNLDRMHTLGLERRNSISEPEITIHEPESLATANDLRIAQCIDTLLDVGARTDRYDLKALAYKKCIVESIVFSRCPLSED